MKLDPNLIPILACPICHGKLEHTPNSQTLICKFDRLIYPIKNGIPVLLASEAKPFSEDQAPAEQQGLN